MKAVIWHGIGRISLDDVDEPQMTDDTDAILKITASSICGTDFDLRCLHNKLVEKFNTAGMSTAILSHHPTGENFTAPASYSRHDYWQWALTATATYGPDFNINLPDSILKDVDLDKVNQRVNFICLQ